MQADRKNYQPVASFGKPGSGPKFVWKDVFSDANEDEPMNNFSLNWEGDKRITKALEIVRSIDDVVDETLYSEDQSHEWLDNVLQLVSDRAFAKMIWEYGGLQFLLKLAGFEDKGFVPQIIRSVVGMQSSSNPEDNTTDKRLLDNLDYKLELEDVIPRLHDLLTCYKYVEPEDEIVSNRSNWVSSLGKIRASIIKKTKERTGSSGSSRDQEPQQAHGTTSTRARRSTADSTKSQTGLMANAPAMTLVWVGMVMISEIAKDGATAIVRSGDVIPPLVSFINIKQPLGDSLSPKLRRLIKAAIGAIGDLATADERAREEFYNRRTAQKLIRLMKGSSHFTKKTLKTLTALATDQRNLRDMIDNGFVEILSNSLNNSDPQIVSQAIKTVLAIAEDEITNALLVDGEFVPKILCILLNDKYGTRAGAIRAIRRLSGNHKARSQIFRHQAVPAMSSLVKSSPEAMLVVESLTSHDQARSLMLENGTLRDLVPLIDNPSTYLAQRAIHTVTAFATHEDALPQIMEQNVVRVLVGALERHSLVNDALDAITQLASYDQVRGILIQSDLFLQLVSILKHQKASLVDRNSVNKPDLPFPNYEEYMSDISAIPIKTVRTVAYLAMHNDLRKKILESDVIGALLDLGAPRHKRKSFASPFAEEDVELSKEVLKTLTKLVRYGLSNFTQLPLATELTRALEDDSRKALMENEVALQLLGWLLVPQFQAPELAYQAMIALKEISEYDDTVPSLMRYPNIGEGVIRARSLSTASHLVREAKVVFEKFSKHPDPESQAKFKQYLSNANPSFADSTDLLAPSNRSQHAASHYGPVESPAHSNDGHGIPPNEPVAADARNQGIRFSLQVPPVHRSAH
ncbi:ARM repeat-containing protein [Ceratobasidium sp. AG-I]|nr:ARM repeat-containing protein [Ceratobasidium sp. AG-I]